MSFSYWEQQSFFHFDAIVIGSGIVGMSAAYYLQEKHPGWKIAILEKGFLPSGASTKNAGFACFGSISELIEQEKIAGANGLHQLIERRWKGLSRLRNLLGDNNIDFQNNGGYEVFDGSNPELEQSCFDKITYYNQLTSDIVGHSKTFSEAYPKIKGFGFGQVSSLIENKFEGQIDTGKMMFALMQKTQSAGVFMRNNCFVEQIESITDGARIFSREGNFFCRHLLLATNAFTGQLSSQTDVVPGRGQVLITKPIPGLKVKGTFHFDKGYFYFRNINDRILLGGGRNLDFKAEETMQFGITTKIQQRLEQLLQTIILPYIPFEIENRWSGIMAFGKEIVPIIQELQPHIYCGVRGNGMGIAMGTQTGFDLANLCD